MPGRIFFGVATLCLMTGPLFGDPLTKTLFPSPNEVMVFLGDDVTYDGHYVRLLEDFFLTRFPEYDIRIVSAGRKGAGIDDAVIEYSHVVSRHAPSHVVVFWSPERAEVFRDFQQQLRKLDRAIRSSGAQPIYLSPLIVDARSARRKSHVETSDPAELKNADLAYFSASLQEFAEQESAEFVDLHGAFNRFTRQMRRLDPDFSLLPDGRHPNEAAHALIAATVLEQLGLEAPLASIQISRQNELLTAEAVGGAVLNLQSTGEQALSFTWLAEALPWIIPAQSGAIPGLADRFNRETLSVHGLPPGRYELLIDDRLIGRFDDVAFRDGIPLHQRSTPQAEQALHVAERNRERHHAAVLPASNERLVVREKLGREPARPETQPSAEYDDSLVKTRDRLASLERIAEEWLAELRELSRPVPRRYVIRPVQTAEVRGRVVVAGMPLSGAMIELHDLAGLSATGATDAMGFYRLTPRSPDGIQPGSAWLVVLANMVLPKFISVEQSGHRVMLRPGVNEIELHFEETPAGE